MNCEYYQELISGLLDGELTEQEEAALSDHLQTCPECAAMYKAFKELSAVMQEDMEEVPESLCMNVMAELRRAEIVKKNRRKSAVKAVFATAACAVLVVAAGRLTGFGGSTGNTSAVVYDQPAVVAAPAAAPVEAYSAAGSYVAQANIDMVPMAPGNDAIMMEESVSFSLRATADESDEAVEEVRRWADLLVLMGNEPAEQVVLDVEPVLSLSVEHEGMYYVLNFFEIEGVLYYLDPMDGSLKYCACSLEELMQ